MGDHGFFTLDVDAKNSSDPDRLREAVRFKLLEEGIDERYFIHQHTVNNGDHYVFRFTPKSPISTHDPNWVGGDSS